MSKPKGTGSIWGAPPTVEKIEFEALSCHAQPPVVGGEMQFNGNTYRVMDVVCVNNLTINVPGIGVMTGPGFRIHATRAF